jgi:mannose-6-phosphate isomerase-like protein (cupin superfamily)
MADLTDHGAKPYIFNVAIAAAENPNFRSTIVTAEHSQLTLMSIPPEETMGIEAHPDNDQYYRIEAGSGRCMMGDAKDNLSIKEEVSAGSMIFVPAGTWHDIVNIGKDDLRMSTIYGPADHVAGTVHKTKQDAIDDPNEH